MNNKRVTPGLADSQWAAVLEVGFCEQNSRVNISGYYRGCAEEEATRRRDMFVQHTGNTRCKRVS